MKKILLADDHIIVRAGVRSMLSKVLKDTDIYEAGDGEGITALLRQYSFDLIILDIHMPNTDTLGLMQFIHITYPDTKVLIFSMSQEKIYAKRFMKEGAKGFISKAAPLQEFKKAIDFILNGRLYISEVFTQLLARESVGELVSSPFEKLSKREFEITQMLLSGHTLNQISKSLNLKASTVGTHKLRVFEKMEIGNVLELKELASFYEV